MNYHAVMIV